MANDRLYLRCTHCDAWMFLSKWYPSSGAGDWVPDAELGAQVNAFLHEHSQAEHIGDWVSTGDTSGFVVDNEITLPSTPAEGRKPESATAETLEGNTGPLTG